MKSRKFKTEKEAQENFKVEMGETSLTDTSNVKIEQVEAKGLLDEFDISVSIKQEEEKEDFVEIKNYCVSCDIAYKRTSSYITHIKRHHNRIIEGNNRRPVSKSFDCKDCEEYFTTELEYTTHCNLPIHKSRQKGQHHSRMDLPRTQKRRNPAIEPDINDPDFYCRSCHYKYSTRDSYRKHLITIHHIDLQPLRIRRTMKSNNIKPDPDDPNFYCKSCDFKYKRYWLYRSHLQKIHHIIVPPRSRKKKIRLDVQPDVDDPNFYCQACQFKYKTYRLYRIHLRKTHHMNIPDERGGHNKITLRLDILPDPDDPNFYCQSCEFKHKTYNSYRSHLTYVHRMNVPSKRGKYSKLIPRPDIQPDMDDPNFYCKSCEHKHKTQSLYRSHLRYVHHMNIPLKNGAKNKVRYDIEPQADDPNFYCRSCKHKYRTQDNYRAHLRKLHNILTPVIRRKDKAKFDVIPDVDRINPYCKACDTKYKSHRVYRAHLRKIHRMGPFSKIIKIYSTPEPL